MLVTFRLCGHLQRLPVSTVFPLLWIPLAVMLLTVVWLNHHFSFAFVRLLEPICAGTLQLRLQDRLYPWLGITGSQSSNIDVYCIDCRHLGRVQNSFQLCLIIITLGAPHPLTYPSFLTHEILSICIPKLQLTSYYHGKLRLKFVQRFAADTHFLFFLLVRFSLQSLAQ